ncbi:lytic murein transglycosylase [Palleronia aestuarii]|uniref:Lytic murein transglycosylase n=1 Tax=Palleronia aestuarii TaxID=568105 RepID=A0A2W7QBA1_9RHOB|nr:lytic murein transglycosylase [Palleronia aestuarii]PZX19029.1 lytic murein transglycosylase [Palleronia aestuarii]
MRRFAAIGVAVWATVQATTSPAQEGIRPVARASVGATIAPLREPIDNIRPRPRPAAQEAPRAAQPGHPRASAFQDWINRFRGRALTQGVAPEVFDRAFSGVSYDPAVIERDRNQSEFTKTLWEYLDSAASDSRVANGRAALEENRAILEAVEARYGVEKEVVAAIWGLESAYGAHRGSTRIVEALATLAFDGRRGRFFEAQLVAALMILQSGDVTAEDMTGSWAGAMGHTQFIPTSYLTYAVDFDGDGHRNIWSEDPTDALASTAAYLNRFGWKTGVPWGVEITLPDTFDFSLARRNDRRMPSEWVALGVRGTDGAAVPDYGEASILLPAGADGAAFMIFSNFEVLERYNTADAYVIGVGHLSDRIAGGPPIRADWPRGDRALTFDERLEMQRRLTSQGFDTKGVDGRIGPLTISAVRSFQRAQGLIPDGYPSLRLLQTLR